jgi:uncharacterized protein (DUF433 family)
MATTKTPVLTIAPVVVPLHRDAHGILRVKHTRLTLDSVLAAWRAGESPAGIVECFDRLVSLAEVHALLAFYYSQQAAVDAYLDAQRATTEAAWQQRQEHAAADPLLERLLAERGRREATDDLASPA